LSATRYALPSRPSAASGAVFLPDIAISSVWSFLASAASSHEEDVEETLAIAAPAAAPAATPAASSSFRWSDSAKAKSSSTKPLVPGSSSSSESIVIISASFRFFDGDDDDDDDVDGDGDDDVIVAGEVEDGDNPARAARAAWASFRMAFIYQAGHSPTSRPVFLYSRQW
jgi:hypothetical protein